MSFRDQVLGWLSREQAGVWRQAGTLSVERTQRSLREVLLVAEGGLCGVGASSEEAAESLLELLEESKSWRAYAALGEELCAAGFELLECGSFARGGARVTVEEGEHALRAFWLASEELGEGLAERVLRSVSC